MDPIIEIVLYIVAAIIAIIVNSHERAMDLKRSELENKLIRYTNYHKIKNRLVNQHCELRLWDRNAGLSLHHSLVLCCKEKTDGKKQGRVFFLTGVEDHTATVWAIFNMEFNSKSNYDSMKSLYKLLRGNDRSVNIKENLKKYYSLLPSNNVENEYCRMELVQSGENEHVIVCTSIWDVSENPMQFVIRGDYEYLFKTLHAFKKNNSKFETFYQLKKKYETSKQDMVVTETEKEVIEAEPEVKMEYDIVEEPIIEEIQKSDERKLDL